MSDLFYVECTAVPDGIHKDAAGVAFARLSVVLRPVPHEPSSPGDPAPANVVDLAAWPTAIPQLGFVISMGPSEDALVPIEGVVPEFDPPGLDPAGAAAANAAAGTWWQQIWRKEEVRKALRRVMAGTPPTSTKVEFYSYTGLADLAYAGSAGDIEIAVTAAIAREGKAAPLAQVQGMAALRRDDPNQPVVRVADAKALLARDAFAGLAIDDAISATLTEMESKSTPEAIAASAAASLREVYADVRATIDGTAPTGQSIKIAEAKRTESWNPLLDPQSTVGAFIESESTATLFETRFANAQFGNALGPGGILSKTSASALALNMAAFRRVMASDEELGVSLSEQAKTPTPEEEAEEVVQRNLAAFQAHPALRKFVRLIVDIPIPVDKLQTLFPGMSKGFVAVEIEGNIGATSMTAFELDPKSQHFEPCPEWKLDPAKNMSLVPSLPLDGGVVQLNIGRQGKYDGSNRFRIEVVDAAASTLNLTTGMQALVEASRKGVPAQDLRGDEPGLRTRGLMVLDGEAVVPAYLQETRARSTPLGLTDKRTLYAEDLVDGYRVDVVAPAKIKITPTLQRRVFPTGDRAIRYDVVDQAFNATGKANPYAAYAGRDEGYVADPMRTWVTPEPGGGSQAYQMKSEVLFCWTGDNLGLPTPWPEGPGAPSIPNLPVDDLQVTPSYDFPPLPGPVLRDGSRYRVMMRARKINGSSVTVEAAEGRLNHALGDPVADEPYVFTPVERAPAPIVLVEKDQILAEVDPKSDQPQATRLLVRPGASARRLLVSPDIGFELAERQGQFDGPTSDSERAVKYGAYARLARHAGGRGFPEFPKNNPAESSRALLFNLLPAGTRPIWPHFVDRTVAFLGTRLHVSGATPEIAVSATSVDEELSYWKRTPIDPKKPGQGFTPEAVRPILIEAVAVGGKSRVLKGPDQKIGPSGSQITVPVLRVEVGRADSLVLEVWANRLGETALQHGAMRRLLSGVRKRISAPGLVASPWRSATVAALGGALAPRAEAREKWWTALTRKARIASMSELVTFTLVHPVEKPLASPSIESINAVRRIDVARWREVADAPLGRNQRDGEATFAFGSIRIDRKSTSRVTAECAWIETHPETCLRRTSIADKPHEIEPQDLYEYRERRADSELFVIDNIPGMSSHAGEDDASYAERANLLSIVDDEAGRKRDLSAAFRTHRARRLVVRLAARSRFAPADPGANLDTYVAKSADDDAFRRCLQGEGTFAGVEAFWLPATRKPAPPGLTTTIGTVYRRRFDAIQTSGGKHKGQRLTHVYRCWLDKDWFDSGPYEKLAIICRNPTTAPLPWLDSQVSRWGGDMSMAAAVALGSSGPNPTYLRTSEIAAPSKVQVGPGAEQIDAIVSKVPLPAPVADDSAGAAAAQRAVDLVLLTPQFHTGYGRWYCDIELKDLPAFRALLQLSVARYQAHAIDGCRLSEARPVNAFLLHQPWTFLASRSGRTIEIVAAGPSYVERAPMIAGLIGADAIGGGGGLPASQQAARPLITVELERLNGEAPLPVMGSNGMAVTTTSRQSTSFEEQAADLPTGWARWKMKLEIPQEPVEAEQFAVRISLSSAHANSRADVPPRPPKPPEPAADGALVYLPEPLVVQLRLPNE